MKKKKILYFMHLDWKWIKQRPHFIAEGLSEYFDITVVYMASKQFFFRDSITITKNDKNLDILPAFRMPFYENRFIYALNRLYMKLYFYFLIKNYKPDYLWITFPQLYDYVPSNINCKIIYDCMDLASGFNYRDDFRSKILEAEKKLIDDSDIVFASSNKLFRTLNENYNSDKFVLVRNAFGGEVIKNRVEKDRNHKYYQIGYVGSISNQRIDFNSLKRTLEAFNNLEYHFIGPSDIDVELEHERIKFYGTLNYDDIYSYVKNFDCLIMPFRMDKLVEYMDPVKLYLYINYNKPIIARYYKELDYFSKFLYFYSNYEDLTNLLTKMIEGGFKKNYSDLERVEFLKKNSWDERIKKIVTSLINI